MDKIYRQIKSDWDFLVVLDACRYDFFSYFYKSYFTGVLNKISSPGSCTREWFRKSFTEYFEEVIYISSNPYINSIHTTTGLDRKNWIFKLNAKDHFFKVIDVWNFGWNHKLGTVHPEIVTRNAIAIRKQYPNKRLIIHYLQPHIPYISKNFIFSGYAKPNINSGRVFAGIAQFNPKLRKLRKLYGGIKFIVNKASFSLGFGNLYIKKLQQVLHLPTWNLMDVTLRQYGIKGLREAYAENLKIVLSHIAFLATRLTGKMIITSDHGEFLGEKRRFGHPCGNYDPILIKVPWFKITSVKKHLGQKQILRYKIADLQRTKKLSMDRFKH